MDYGFFDTLKFIDDDVDKRVTLKSRARDTKQHNNLRNGFHNQNKEHNIYLKQEPKSDFIEVENLSLCKTIKRKERSVKNKVYQVTSKPSNSRGAENNFALEDPQLQSLEGNINGDDTCALQETEKLVFQVMVAATTKKVIACH